MTTTTPDPAALDAERARIRAAHPVYFRDPDGARIELIADPLGEMYGHQVL